MSTMRSPIDQRSLIDQIAAEDLLRWSDDDLEDDLVELRRGLDALQRQFLRRLAEIDRREVYRRDGFTSTTAYLKSRCRMGGRAAREDVRMARALRQMPLVDAALTTGEITYDAARLLSRAAETDGGAYLDHEEALVEVARGLPATQLRAVLDHWCQQVRPIEAVEVERRQHAERQVHLSRTFDGMIRIDGWLPPAMGDVVATALAAITTPHDRAAGAARAAEEPIPTPAQRRADGLVELCRQWLELGTMVVGGEKPHVSLLVDLATLERRAGRACETAHAGVITAEEARMIACDAGVARVITDGDSMPLDVGRRTRTIPPAIRRALHVRDRQCRFPGCDRPDPWCDGHHVLHWVDGGPTALENLILLCRSHHRLVHVGGFAVNGTGAEPVFSRPDGSRLDDP